MKLFHKLFLSLLISFISVQFVAAERIKDISSIAGVRDNQLIGYGLVVGLNGTGDSDNLTTQTIGSMLRQFGISLPPGTNLNMDNIAAVVVHGNLPPFAKRGQKIDVTVSSLGSAESLHGGSLLMTPLKGIDGNVYAIAQGNLIVGGFGVEAQDGSSISVNIPSAGRIPGGATVERIVANSFGHGEHLVLNLHEPDFTTANRVADAINEWIGLGTASPLDGSSVKVTAPTDHAQRVAFASIIENIEVTPGDASAKVIVNSRTGTVVIGRNVKVTEAAVSHGSLVVTITDNPVISQPGPLSEGDTVVVPNTDIEVEQEQNRMFLFNPGIKLDDIVQAVNQVGAAPGDLVAILEALKQAGALRAELIVI